MIFTAAILLLSLAGTTTSEEQLLPLRLHAEPEIALAGTAVLGFYTSARALAGVPPRA
jgi:hypothetical protein